MLTEAALSLVGLFAIYKLFIQNNKLAGIPGPKPWPLVGNIFQIDTSAPPLVMEKWAKMYGPVFKVNLSGEDHIVVTGTEAIYEVLATRADDFADRMSKEKFRFKLWSMNFSDLIFMNYSNKCKLMRKTMMKALKQHNLKHIEESTLDVVKDLIQDFKNQNEKPFDPLDFFYTRLFQFLYILVLGKKADANDPDLEKLATWDKLTAEVLAVTGTRPLLDVFPWLRVLGNQTYKDLVKITKLGEEIFAKWKHDLEQGRYKDDCWFKQLLDMKEKDEEDWTEANLIMLVMDVFGAGSLTTTTTLMVLLNVLAHNPQVQKALQHEVDSVIGDDEITFKDREHMPYTYACMLEATRYNAIFPLVIRATHCDTSVAGYQVPKNTPVFINTWAQNQNPHLFPQPQKFRPERFLTSEGKLVLAGEDPRKHLFSFGAGTRSCPGEVLAMTRMFLIIASIARKFDVLPATTVEEQESIHPHNLKLGNVLQPRPYKIRMVPRS